MPESEAKSYHVGDGKAAAGQSLHPHQSAWMAHWTRTSSDASPSSHDHLSHYSRNVVDNHDGKKHHAQSTAEVAFDNFRSSEGIGDVDLVASLKKPSSQSFPFFKLGRESGISPVLRNEGETREVQALSPQVSHKKSTTTLNVETTPSEPHFQSEDVFQIPKEQVKYHMFFGDSNHSCSRSKEKVTGSASHIRTDQGAHKLDSRSTCRQGGVNQLKPVFPSKEYFSETNLKVMEQEHSNPPYLRQKNAALFGVGPSTSSNHTPAFIEHFQKMHNHFGMRLSPHQTGHPEMTISGTVHHEQCSLQHSPHFVQNVETMRICTPLDPAEALVGGLHRFSTTTHSFFITKHTDVSLYQESRIVKESRLSTQPKDNTFSELLHNPQHFAHGHQGVRLQLLGSSSDSDIKEDTNVKTARDVQKNESSAETDAMDMELFKNKERNHHCGLMSSVSNKDNVNKSSSLPVSSTALAKEKDRHHKQKSKIPDINLELPALPAASSSMEKAEQCPSRTQSLDMNTLFNVDNTSNSKSNDCSGSHLNPEPESRWIKRLKLNASSSQAIGTKNSNLGEASCHGKGSKLLSKSLECNNSTSRPHAATDKIHTKESEALVDKCMHKEPAPVIGKCPSKEPPALDQATAISNKAESSSVGTRKGGEEITLSHSWIRRWSRYQGSNNPETVQTCELQHSKLALEEFQKKQFPSVGAMALMGKAMTGFQQCEFQKKESCVVWNTKGIQ